MNKCDLEETKRLAIEKFRAIVSGDSFKWRENAFGDGYWIEHFSLLHRTSEAGSSTSLYFNGVRLVIDRFKRSEDGSSDRTEDEKLITDTAMRIIAEECRLRDERDCLLLQKALGIGQRKPWWKFWN